MSDHTQHTLSENIRSADGTLIATQYTSTGDNSSDTRASRPRAQILITHGFGEHQGRYAHVAARLVKEGYAVTTYDLRGHGDSAGPRGHAPSHDALLDDLQAVMHAAKTRLPQAPLILLGHSMGGNITANFALKRPEGIAAVVLSAPWFKLAAEPPAWKVMLGRSIGAVFPAFAMPAGVDAALLSHDAQVVRAYQQDPKVHGKISASMFFGCRDAAAWAIAQASSLKQPMLIQHGGDDGLISPLGSSEFFAQAPKALATRQEYSGLYHEIYNESDNAAVWNDLLQWLARRNWKLAHEA